MSTRAIEQPEPGTRGVALLSRACPDVLEADVAQRSRGTSQVVEGTGGSKAPSPFSPSGLRLSTALRTSRSMKGALQNRLAHLLGPLFFFANVCFGSRGHLVFTTALGQSA